MAAAALALLTASALAQIPIPAFFSPVVETFDSMGSAGTTTPTGWFVGSGTLADTSIVSVGTGSSATGGNYNFGLSGDSDRALGSLASGTGGTRNTEGRFQNLTGGDIGGLEILYDGEQWRLGASPSLETGLTLQFSSDGTTFVSLGPSFNFPPPVTIGAVGPFNGNDPANRIPLIGGTYVPPAPIPSGSLFYLRWVDLDDAGSDSGVAIDNVKIFAAPVPEPHEYALVAGLGLFAFVLIRRQLLKPT
jgi:hypothetical protein